MDLRVLTAVFVTLLAIAIGMSQGGLTSEDVLDAVKDFSSTRTSIADVLQERAKKQSNNTVSASLETRSPLQLEIGMPTTVGVGTAPGTQLRIGDSTLTSSGDEPVRFAGFTGSVTVRRGNLSLDGTASLVDTGGFTFNYSTPKRVTVDEAMLADASFTAVRQQTITFQNATGAVTVKGTEVSLSQEQVILEAFNGNISITAPTTYRFDGTFHRAVLGAGTFGG